MNSSRSRMTVCLMSVMLGADATSATILTGMPVDPVPLPRRHVFSKNEAFVLDVDATAGRNTVYRVADRSMPLWSIPGVLKSDVERILLADDGSVVVLVLAIPPLSPDPRSAEAIRLIDRYGRQRSYTVSELKTEAAPVYGCQNSARWLDSVIDHGDRFVIRTTDGNEQAFRYSTQAPRSKRFGWWDVAASGLICGVVLARLNVILKRRRRGLTPPPLVDESPASLPTAP